MAQFRFRFESVERLRRLQEVQTAAAFAGAQRLVDDIQREKTAMQVKLRAALDERESLGEVAEVGPEHWAIQEAFVQGLKVWLQQIEYKLFKAQKILEKARLQLVEARKKLKTMEQIRARDLSRWKEEITHKEEKTIQDTLVMRARFQVNPMADDPENESVERDEEGERSW